MWKIVQGSVTGTSHEVTGTPCQDSHCAVTIPINGQLALLVACADGAGSASLSGRGADYVCKHFVEIVSRDIGSGLSIDAIDRPKVIEWCREVRTGLEALAVELACELRDLASTFLGAIVFDEIGVFIQIGDGAIVTFHSGLYEVAFWPQSGEYANTTNFITDQKFEERIEFLVLSDRQILSLAVFTDGLERLILRFYDRTVHIPFLEPLFATLGTCASSEELLEPLRMFLSSDRINERTDDDKTLVLATRLNTMPDGDATL